MPNSIRDAFRYFSPATLLEGDGEGFVVVLMHPADFLRLAAPISRRIADENRLDAVNHCIETQTAFSSLCFLGIDIQGETGYIQAHEGRHRATALLARGVAEIPVALELDAFPKEALSLAAVHQLTEIFPQGPDDDEDYPNDDSDDLRERDQPILPAVVWGDHVYSREDVLAALEIEAGTHPKP